MTRNVWTVGVIAGGVLVTAALAQEPKKATKPAAKPAAAAKGAAAPAGLTSTQQQASYGLGITLGRQLKGQSIEPEMDCFIMGLKDGLAGNKSQLSDEVVQAALTAFQQEVIAKQQAAMKAEAETNLKAGAAFLAANAKKEGVKTLPSGLQYKVLKEGKGATPKASDTVVTHYQGTLIDGMEFDSSYKRGEPATFPVTGVIKGWTEALQLMKAGSKWQLVIPPDLAYGAQGSPPVIPPNSTLIFDIELLEVQKAPDAKK